MWEHLPTGRTYHYVQTWPSHKSVFFKEQNDLPSYEPSLIMHCNLDGLCFSTVPRTTPVLHLLLLASIHLLPHTLAAAYPMDACSACILLLTLIHLLSSVTARDYLSAGSSLSVRGGPHWIQRYSTECPFFLKQNSMCSIPHVYGSKKAKITQQNRLLWSHYGPNILSCSPTIPYLRPTRPKIYVI